MKDGLPQAIDIWWSKVENYGWKIKDCPSPAIRKELRRRLNDKKNEN
jgi:hypothetical protein